MRGSGRVKVCIPGAGSVLKRGKGQADGRDAEVAKRSRNQLLLPGCGCKLEERSQLRES
jgi:hypothetical protein